MALTRFLGIFALLVAMSNEVFFAQAEPLPTTAVIIIDKEVLNTTI